MPKQKPETDVRKKSKPNLQITVSEKVIANSIRADSGHCMIAEAIKETAREKGLKLGFIAVDLQTIRVTNLLSRLRYIYLTPPMAQMALVKFDNGEVITPFKFTLYRDRAVQVLPYRGKGVSSEPAKIKVRSQTTRTNRKPDGDKNVQTIGQKPKIMGGKAPPTAALRSPAYRGRTRSFGMRFLAQAAQALKAQQPAGFGSRWDAS